MTSELNNGIISIPSHHSVDETVNKAESTFAAKGIKLFGLIDHSGEAETSCRVSLAQTAAVRSAETSWSGWRFPAACAPPS